MARDMDFIRKKSISSNQVPRDTTLSALTTPEPKRINPIFPEKQPSNRKYHIVGWAMVLLVVGVVVTLTYLYYLSLQKADTESSNPSPTKSSATIPKLTVQVYDRGAGEVAITAALTKLTSVNLTSEKSTISTLTYDKSYIFYNTQYKLEATLIQNTLSNFVFEMKESPLPGVSVYLGKS